MYFLEKINHKKYLIFTLLNFLALFGALGQSKFLYILFFFLVLFLNQLFLIEGFAPFFEKIKKIKKIKVFILLVSKLIIHFSIFYYIATYERDVVLFYLGSYTFQLIILVISIKRLQSIN